MIHLILHLQMRICLIIIATFCLSTAFAQTMLLNKRPIDTDRYGDISGNPYYFDEPVAGIVYLKTGEAPYKLNINVNLYELGLEAFEVKDYATIDFKNVENVLVLNQNGVDSTWIYLVGRDLIVKLYSSDTYQLYERPLVKMQTIIQRPPGQIIEKKKFIRRNAYTLKTAKGAEDIDLNKKSVSKVLGKDAEALAKKKKLELKSLKDLVALLRELEQ